ncbi:MAG: Crp/Fnr family transcriptional regulator [Schleiferiaceae bacterium]|jgi:CRP/FNR family transcriptional regulator
MVPVSKIQEALGFASVELAETLAREGRILTFRSGDFVMEPGQSMKYVPIVLEGSLRVARKDEADDRELYLYTLEPGSACSNTFGSLYGQSPSLEVVAEEDSTVLCVPIAVVQNLLHSNTEWMNYVLRSYQKRFDEALNALDDVAFRQLDERLLHFLHEKARRSDDRTVHLSHFDIAQALNSSREVVSRLLKRLESEGQVKLGRNRIEILD